MREAPVGYQCFECAQAERQQTRRPRTVAGAELSSKPVVVPVLIALNLTIFVITAVQAGSAGSNQRSDVFAEFALWPVAVAGGEWWRIVGSGFLHFGLIHLAMNMFALWIIGKDLELVLGRLRFLAVYALSLLGGSAAVFLFSTQFTAGASGAVFGLMGGIAVAAMRLRVSLGPVLTVIALNIVFTVTVPGISLFGHLGGLVVGALATGALVYAPAPRRNAWQSGAMITLLVVLVGMIVVGDIQFGPITCTGTGMATNCLPV